MRGEERREREFGCVRGRVDEKDFCDFGTFGVKFNFNFILKFNSLNLKHTIAIRRKYLINQTY